MSDEDIFFIINPNDVIIKAIKLQADGIPVIGENNRIDLSLLVGHIDTPVPTSINPLSAVRERAYIKGYHTWEKKTPPNIREQRD